MPTQSFSFVAVLQLGLELELCLVLFIFHLSGEMAASDVLKVESCATLRFTRPSNIEMSGEKKHVILQKCYPNIYAI